MCCTNCVVDEVRDCTRQLESMTTLMTMAMMMLSTSRLLLLLLPVCHSV